MKQTTLGNISAIPCGEGRTFMLDSEEIAVFRGRDGQVFATQAHCPHRAGPLADGLLGSQKLTCPLHEWTFDLHTGEVLTGDCSIRVYPIRCDEDGTIVLESTR